MSTARHRSTVVLLTLILFGLGFALPALAHDPSSSPGEGVSDSARARGEQLTMNLVRLNTQYQLAEHGRKPQLEQDLLAAALTREQELLGLIESAPGEVLLHFAATHPTHLLTGAQVRVHGVQLDQALVLDGGGSVLQ